MYFLPIGAMPIQPATRPWWNLQGSERHQL